jgi:ATP-dependent phosphoenolpyruvate carboxykinase
MATLAYVHPRYRLSLTAQLIRCFQWDPKYRIKVRVICARAYHALFMHNMLIRPTEAELAEFGEPDFIIYNAGQFPANRFTKGMSSTTSVEINFKRMEMVILGTEYAGEMKKGVFSVMVCLSLWVSVLVLVLKMAYSTTCSRSNLVSSRCTRPRTSGSTTAT